MVIMDEISSIKIFFQSHNVNFSTAWLEGCVSWCKEENLPPHYTPKDLQHKVFEQWLLLDLRDVEVPSLPPDLSNKTKYILNGDYSLQMMKVIDISRPKHWQLQRIRNNVSKNVEPEIESSKRVLQLTLSDGIQEVEAMEYRPISCLNLNMSPGIKIRLIGPITVRRGRLMLESRNVKVLGGEVEDLIVPNAAENILAKILKLPLNPTPNVIEESLLTANNDMFNNAGVNTTQNQSHLRNNVAIPPNAANKSTRNPQPCGITNMPHNVARLPTRQNEDIMMDISEEEELRIAAQVDMLLETQSAFEESSANRMSKSKTPDMFNDADFDDSVFASIEIPPAVIERTPEPMKIPPNKERKGSAHSNIDESLEFGNEFFENFDIDAHLDQAMEESKCKPRTPQKLVLTIEKLMKNIPNISNGKFKIRAKFCSVVEKLTVADDEYHLVVKVVDDTGDLNAKIHSDVVSDFSGCCAAALMSISDAAREEDTEAQEKVIKVIGRIKEKLVQLNNIVEVQVNSKEKYPVILNVLE